jgi:hypothetical protein
VLVLFELIPRTAVAGEKVYYSLVQLTNSPVPVWNGTNAIPLNPDLAVKAAIKYANLNISETSWELDHLEIRRLSTETPWYYSISLTDGKSEPMQFETIRVLMNGEVWKPYMIKK